MPSATQPIQSGNSRTSSDWRMPPAMPRYHAARYASVRLPLSARKPKYATVDAKSASPAYVRPTEP